LPQYGSSNNPLPKNGREKEGTCGGQNGDIVAKPVEQVFTPVNKN